MKGSQVISNEGPNPIRRGDNYEIALTKFKNISLQKHWANFNEIWHKESSNVGDSRFYKQGPFNSQREVNVFFPLLINVMILSLLCSNVFIDLNCFLRLVMWPVSLLLCINSIVKHTR